ncbi:CCR4-NOT transcription complex subunit 4 [Lates japonicus]|uniref:CCR4-NOT transcription complex subunit 4 n=1 Tax=Lates japonicus TaxID=270547 RepID=A0AAD3N6T8_LATJO|nr:CCR4-NOT transcription complex subunit 4 [Lates japonicus]
MFRTASLQLGLFRINTSPVSSSTDWQAAFGFGSYKQQQEGNMGFNPFDVTCRAPADLIEKDLCVKDSFSSSLSPSFFPHRTHRPLLNKGLGPQRGLPFSSQVPHSPCPPESAPSDRRLQHLQLPHSPFFIIIIIVIIIFVIFILLLLHHLFSVWSVLDGFHLHSQSTSLHLKQQLLGSYSAASHTTALSW